MRSRGIGKTRQKLAERVRELLIEKGIDVNGFDGSNLIPVTGHWKGEDCYRWESAGITHNIPGGSQSLPLSVASWSPMTACIRAKSLVLSQDKAFTFEVDPA